METTSPAWSTCIYGPPPLPLRASLSTPTARRLWRGWATVPQIDGGEAGGPRASWKCRSNAVAAPSSRTCRSDPGSRGQTVDAVGPPCSQIRTWTRPSWVPRPRVFPLPTPPPWFLEPRPAQAGETQDDGRPPDQPPQAGWSPGWTGWVSLPKVQPQAERVKGKPQCFLQEKKKKRKRKVSMKCCKEPRTLPGKPGWARSMCESHSPHVVWCPQDTLISQGVFKFPPMAGKIFGANFKTGWNNQCDLWF